MPLENNMTLRLFTSLSPCENKHRCLLPTPLRWACCQNSTLRTTLPLSTHHSFSLANISHKSLWLPQPFSSRKASLWILASICSKTSQLPCLTENVKYCFFLMLPQIAPHFMFPAQISALSPDQQHSWHRHWETSRENISNVTLEVFPLQSSCISVYDMGIHPEGSHLG